MYVHARTHFLVIICRFGNEMRMKKNKGHSYSSGFWYSYLHCWYSFNEVSKRNFIMKKYLFIALLVGVWSCEDEKSEPVNGCIDPDATNYNSDATIDDGSCEYDLALVSGNVTDVFFTQGEETAYMFFTLWNNGTQTANNIRYRLKINYKCLSNSTSQSDLLALGTIPFSLEPDEGVETEAYVKRCSGSGIDEFTFEIYELIWD